MAAVHQLSLSDGGVPKRPVDRVKVGELGVVGDIQADKRYHGGPDRALCLFSLEVIEKMQSEGHQIEPGFAGENITIRGLDWDNVRPGTRLRIGQEVEIEIVSFTAPCKKNAGWFIDGDFTRMLQSRHPGESRLYARVLKAGEIATGDQVVEI